MDDNILLFHPECLLLKKGEGLLSLPERTLVVCPECQAVLVETHISGYPLDHAEIAGVKYDVIRLRYVRTCPSGGHRLSNVWVACRDNLKSE